MGRDIAQRTGREVVEELLELLLRCIVRAAVLARVENDQGAMLEVVDPLLWRNGVVRAVDLSEGGYRGKAGYGVVRSRSGWTERIALNGPHRDVAEAHV